MIELSASKAREEMAKVLSGVMRGHRFLLNRHGKPVAAIVSPEDLAFLQALEDRRDARCRAFGVGGYQGERCHSLG